MADEQKSGTQSDRWIFWHAELEQARKVKGYDQWQTRAKKIIKRYRDERSDAGDTQDSAGSDSSKFNILWSNVQTLMPALFSKTPKPVVQRRYLDSDDVGRTATVILERALMYELDDGLYTGAMRKCVLDRLLPGRGVAWVRYEPRFTPMPGKTQEAVEDETAPAEQALGEDTQGEEDEGETDDGQVEEEVASESTPVDYIDWKDFDTSPARTWEECWWISKTVHMTRKELVKRFPKYGAKIPLDYSPAESDKQQPGSNAGAGDQGKRAKIKEIWNKRDRKVIWLSESFSEDILEEKPDPLKLEGFYPCPRPLFATLTNDSLVPVPDFYEYQDQATELDDLTARISAVTKAIKVAGVYDASVPELQRMFEEGFENRLVPADNMSEFAQKAGATGMGHIWLLPVKDLVQVLTELYIAREQVKQSLYEITGISDIVRGGDTGGAAKTATEQRIKGQFASMRLNDMQAEVSRFARDLLRIMGEIISEHFDPMTLFMISGYEQWAKDQWPPEEAPQPPMMGHNGGPPMAPAGAPPAAMGAPGTAQPSSPAGMQPAMMGMPPPDPAQVARQKAADMFQKAVALLKNEKLRGFRIEIETDSLIEADKQEVQRARSEFLAAVGQFLTQAVPLGQALPEFMPLLGKMLLFGVRGFSASRDLESAFEQMIDELQKKAKNPTPPPPSPEQIKAESEKAKMAMEQQQAAAQFQSDQAMRKMDMDALQQKHAMDLEKMRAELEMKREEMNIKREELAMRQQELAMDAQAAQQKAALDAQSMDRKASLDAQTDTRKAEQGERSHELALETMEAKAEMAKKPKEQAA
jgi:hypothetical protein